MADFAADAEARPDPLADVALKDIVDASSCANCDEYRVTHVLLELEVDMKARAFDGHCTLSVERLPECASDELVLDAHESMAVDGVVVDGSRAKFECSRYCDFGSRLVVFLPKGFVAGDVDVSYRTSGEPAATWLDAQEACATKGGHLLILTNTDELETFALQRQLADGTVLLISGKDVCHPAANGEDEAANKINRRRRVDIAEDRNEAGG